MKKYYIVKNGQVVSTAKAIGNFENLWNAKDAAFDEMMAGDLLIGFNLDVDAEVTDEYGYDTVDTSKAEDDEKSYLCETDGSIEDVPEGLYYWSDDTQDTTFYRPNGEEWYGDPDTWSDYIVLYGSYDNEHPEDHYKNRKSLGKVFDSADEAAEHAEEGGVIWEIEHYEDSGDIQCVRRIKAV